MFVSYKSSLRVYEPVWAFHPAERARWMRYANRERATGSLERERGAMLQAVISTRLDFGRLEVDEEALVAEWSGNLVVCPLDTHSRALQAIIDSEWALPFPLSDLTFGRAVRRQAAGRQLRPRATRGSDAKDHMLTASWDVPFWWSLLFCREDAVPTADLESLVYRAPVATAVRRGEEAYALITDTFGATPFISDLDVAVRWLGTFDQDSMVELDYGSLGPLVVSLSEDGDDSMALASDSIAHLKDGDLEQALTAYQEYISTWEDVARLESWN
ncbi:hypothetical protein [Blastococcus sp. Marseille-P5729]|uniref:hypothetical protein n=1 Tax=Blastococcus sp. Marseille-P5729 TaxID=2086582 RepID=UPI000D10E978|nr:hypothetical protein [Blastococcus sp. Marseille-P5729]